MKIAILFYGQLRWYELANSTFQKNFQPALSGHDIQYFAHFCNDQFLPQFQEMYQPLIVKITPQKSIDDVKKLLNNHSQKVSDNLPKQLESLYETSLLLEKFQKDNNTQFDLYIKTRTDLAFLNQINFDNFDSNSVYVAKTARNLLDYVQDLTLFTKKYDHIKKVSEMGFYLDEIVTRLEKQNPTRHLFYHEEILANYLFNQKITPKSHNFTIELARHHI